MVFFHSGLLKWKDAFELNDNFKSYVALNPLQNFFTTLQFRKPSFDDAKAKAYFPLIADFLQLDSKIFATKIIQEKYYLTVSRWKAGPTWFW